MNEPVIAILGRPNVGKSTLFNCLVGKPQALVHDQPGVTRDRHFGQATFNGKPYLVIDTGGVTGKEEGMDVLMAGQSWQAVLEADLVLFVVDARTGLTPQDQHIATALRRIEKRVICVVNKTEGLDEYVALADFYVMGFQEIYGISAAHKHKISLLIEAALQPFFKKEEDTQVTEKLEDSSIKIAIVGRPNVGKSTLVNRLLGEDRVIVYDQPGTTRDSIEIAMEKSGQAYTLVDTAGIRRRKNIDEAIEKFSVVKTLQSIEAADVIIYLIDAQEGVTDQDLSLLGFILDAGRALVMAINKWDGLSLEQKETVESQIDRQLYFVNFANRYYISALHGSGVGLLWSAINRAYESATRRIPTGRLTRLLQQAIAAHQPPTVGGHRIKLRYAHTGGHLPPIIVVHGNQTESLPLTYQRYLMNFFIEKLKLVGTPIQFQFKSSDNPYAGRKNKPSKMGKKRRKY